MTIMNETRIVVKKWHVRCGLTVFTQPLGTTVTLCQYDKDTRKYLVDFGDRLIDWFHWSVIDEYCPDFSGKK